VFGKCYLLLIVYFFPLNSLTIFLYSSLLIIFEKGKLKGSFKLNSGMNVTLLLLLNQLLDILIKQLRPKKERKLKNKQPSVKSWK